MRQLILLSILFVVTSNAKAVTEYYSLAYRNDPATSVVIGWSGDLGTVHYGLVDEGTTEPNEEFIEEASPDVHMI